MFAIRTTQESAPLKGIWELLTDKFGAFGDYKYNKGDLKENL